MHFMTNGYNYWFAKGGGGNAVDCGMIAVLDYFNCKIDGQPFRSLCQTATICERFGNMEDIWAHLRSGQKEKAKTLRKLKETDVESLTKKGPDKPFVKRPNPWGREGGDEFEYEGEDGRACCPLHRWSTFNARKPPHVQGAYETCRDYTRRKLFGAPLLMLNQELVINESNIKIVGDKMFFLPGSNDKPLPTINFAACWNSQEHVPDFIVIDQEISAPRLLIPSTMLRKFDQGYHLVLDFFRNDWMVQVNDEYTISVPIISNDLVKAPFSSRFRHCSFGFN